MKKRILLTLAMSLLLVVILALSVSATQIGDLHYTLTESTDYDGFDGYAILSTDNQKITISEVVIPESVTYEEKTYKVTEAAYRAFYNNTKITSVEFGGNMVKFNDQVFNGAKNINRVNYTGTLEQWFNTYFGANTTNGNDTANPINYAKNLYINGNLLTELVVPSTVTTINPHLFRNCESLTKITIPNTVTAIRSNAFSGCVNIAEFKYTGTINEWVKNISFGNESSVPVTVNSKVYFANVQLEADFTLPEDVTSINAYAFAKFPFVSVKLHNGLLYNKIGNYAFSQCTVLESVQLPSNLTRVTHGMFNGCTALNDIVIPETVTNFVNYCFQNCSSLETINIPSGAKEFGQYSFKGCSSLYYINGTNGVLIFNEGTTYVNSFAFSECDRLEYVEFPSTIKNVGQGAFCYCNNLKLVSFDKVNAKITNAIANGESYTKVEFPSCGVFKGCPSLVAMSIPEGTTSLPDRFIAENCNSLTAVYMPDSMQTLRLNGVNQGSFDNAPNMYFVDKPFTVGQCYDGETLDLSKLVLPEKPTVYYMPSSLTGFSGNQLYTNNNQRGSMFINCKSINDVLVFGENFVDMRATAAFSGIGADSPKTVVFLGQLTQFVWGEGNANVTFVFANENVTDVTNMGLIKVYSTNNASNYKNTGSVVFFCSSGKAYNFDVLSIANRSKDVNDALYAELAAALTENADNHAYKCQDITDATCTETGLIKYYCPCGKYNLSLNETIDAKGHTKGEFDTIKYDNGFLKVGYYYYKCTACDVESFTILDKAEYQVPAIFVNNGYSYSGTAILQGFAVNFEALELYETTGKTLQYGLAVASVAKLGATNTLFDGTTLKEGAFSVSFDDKKQYSIFEMQVTGLVDDYKDAELFVCAYVIDGDTVTYISNGANTTTVEAVTYNQVVANAEANQTTDIIVNKEENV
ncbi:MAG: leucine-rich repeat domain-containing protein [Clostridia bacterium]|nr:leucine-rich repeat domain-containing protein [Clostridia bacterium]